MISRRVYLRGCRNHPTARLSVISNSLFDFEHENRSGMATLDSSLELDTEMANMIPCHALPGSPMYSRVIEKGEAVLRRDEEFGFSNYETRPLPTKFLGSEEFLKFRDQAWQTQLTNPRPLGLVENKFGYEQQANVEAMASICLRRKILGHRS